MTGRGGARGGASGRGASRPTRAGAKNPRPAPKSSARFDLPPAPAEAPRVFTLGVVAGATPGKWVSAWRDRMPHVELVLFPLTVTEQRAALAEGRVDAALVRLPLDDDALHVVRLYDEVSVAIMGSESHLTAADALELADLHGEVIVVPDDDVLGVRVPGGVPPAFTPPTDTGEAVETVAAGVGVVLAPMSIARLHARKDAAARPVRDAPVSTVALVWPREATTPDVETFVGIVRGRTANSSR